MFFDGGNYTRKDLESLQHFQMRSKRNNEYSSACPSCGGEDRFRFWPDVGNYWCRQCGLRGFVSDAPETTFSFSDLTSSTITSDTPEFDGWKEYFNNIYKYPLGEYYWKGALGPNYMAAIEHFKLGYCPDYHNYGPTVTIPITLRGKCYIVKHRIIQPKSNKYTTEPRHIPSIMFNLDESILYDKIIITEGEKKVIRLWLEGYPAISSTAGAGGFSINWSVFLIGKEVLLLFDPDDAGQAAANHLMKSIKAINIVLDDKVDDLINGGFNIQEVLGKPWR